MTTQDDLYKTSIDIHKDFISAATKKVLLAAEKGLDAPIFERRSIRRGKKPFFTPYSISVLSSNGNFSHKKASDELGYSPRDLSDTLSDTLRWLSSLPI